MTKTKLVSLIGKSFGPVFYAALLLFLFFYVQSLDWSALSGVTVSWAAVIVATVLGIIARYWGAIIWCVLLVGLGAKNIKSQLPELFAVYAKSWLGRYIPGTAPWILGKIFFASRLGVSKNKLAVSSLLEGGLQIIVTLVIAVAILLFDERVDTVISSELKLFMVAALIAGVISVLPPVFNRFFALAYKTVKKKVFPVEHQATSRTIVKGSLLYVIGSFIGGLSFFFIAKAFYEPLTFGDILFVIGASNLASAASMLAVFAPSGIGVREGIQVVLLSLIMPVEIALLIAVATRVWSVGVDLLFFGLASTVKRLRA